MAKVIGIDLGTTNTVIAVMDGARPRVLRTREGHSELRSTLSLKIQRDPATGGERREELLGHAAEDNARLAPRDTIVSIKRLMGRSVGDPEIARVRAQYPYIIVPPSDGTRDSIRVLLDGAPLSPIDVSARLLRRAKDDAQLACGEELKYAVITVPAYFSEAQRAATKQAATRAGLHVVRLLDEPTAAAVAYGMDHGERDVKTLLVYDLGGGTFDLSVLMIAGSVFAPLALQGDMWLGGDDFDQKLIEVVLERVAREYGVDGRHSQRFMGELGRAARATKEHLSQSEASELIVPGGLIEGVPELCTPFTRAQFEALIHPLVARTLQLTRRALEDAQLSPERIDHVLLAGNSSRLPLVQREMAAIFGADKILRSVAPKHSVALGAAIVGARVGERIICQARTAGRSECGQLNAAEASHCERPGCGAPLPTASDDGLLFAASVAPFHYGAQCADDGFALFVRKGDPYPTSDPVTQIFGTTRPNQRIVTVPVYGGERLERASGNEKQGEAVALLPPGLPRGATVAITLGLDAEGLFTLSARAGDGSDLQALKTQGEADARAIAILLEVEQVLAQRGAPTPAAARAEATVNRVFEALRSGETAAALQLAEQLRARVLERPAPGSAELRSRREALIGYCERIAERYRWVDPAEMLSFAGVTARARAALESGSPEALEAEMVTLERAWRDLPKLVRRFVDCREAIALRVRPLDWAGAARLERDMEGLEQAFKGKNRRAEEWWDGFAKRLAQELARVEAQRAAQLRCVRGHDVPPGRRHCPVQGCGADVTGLVHKSSAQPLGTAERSGAQPLAAAQGSGAQPLAAADRSSAATQPAPGEPQHAAAADRNDARSPAATDTGGAQPPTARPPQRAVPAA